MAATADDITTAESGNKAVSSRSLSKSGHDNEAWKAGFTSCTEELPPTVLEFPGLPSDFPVGTYFVMATGDLNRTTVVLEYFICLMEMG